MSSVRPKNKCFSSRPPKSTNKVSNLPINTNQLTKRPAYRPTNLATYQAANLPTNQLVIHPTNQPTPGAAKAASVLRTNAFLVGHRNGQIRRPLQSVERVRFPKTSPSTTNLPMNTNQLTNRPAYRPTNLATYQAANLPTYQPSNIHHTNEHEMLHQHNVW